MTTFEELVQMLFLILFLTTSITFITSVMTWFAPLQCSPHVQVHFVVSVQQQYIVLLDIITAS